MTLWRHRDFAKLWMAQTVSEIGSRITREGLPMGAVLLMGVGPITMSGLSLMAQLPASLLGLFVGVLVDRLPRRPLLMVADVGRALLLMTIPAAALMDQLRLWMFFVVSALAGIFTLLFDVSYQAYVPWLVGRQNLMEANSKLSVTESMAEVVGPGMTGVLVQALTAPIAIFFDAVSYFFSAILVGTIGIKETLGQTRATKFEDDQVAEEIRPDPSPRNWRGELSDGLSALRGNRTLLALAGVAATSGFMGSALFVLDTLYALRNLHLTAFLFGLTVTMGGIGSLIGAGLAKRVLRWLGVGRAMAASLIVRGIFAFAWALAGGPIWRSTFLLLLWQLFGDTAGTIYDILDTTLRQTLVKDELLGRVNSVVKVAAVGLTAIGSLASGLVAFAVGIRETLLFAAIGMVLTSLWAILSPVIRLDRMPEFGGSEPNSTGCN